LTNHAKSLLQLRFGLTQNCGISLDFVYYTIAAVKVKKRKDAYFS